MADPFTTATALSLLRRAAADLLDGITMHPGAVGQLIPPMPDRIVVVTVTGGGPLGLDGLLDAPTVQVRVRGHQRDPLDAERIALGIDRALIWGDWPADIDTVRVVSVDRTGGRPTALASPPGGARSEYICSYLVRAFLL